MADLDELKEIKVSLPAYLIGLFKQQAEYTGRSFNDELANVLEKAIFLSPDDLDAAKSAAEAKAELDAIREASAEESMALLRKIRERNRVVNEISILNPIKW